MKDLNRVKRDLTKMFTDRDMSLDAYRYALTLVKEIEELNARVQNERTEK